MSVRAVSWALEEAPVTDPTALLVLIGLADKAGSDGTGAFPSQKTLADRARSSDRTVRRKLNELEQAGIIVRGDQDLVSHYVADRRPVVWDICYESSTGQSDRADTGDQTTGHSGPNDRTTVSDKPSLSTTYLKPSLNRSKVQREDELFEEWWKIYPRPDSKVKARKNYSAALKKLNGDQALLLESLREWLRRNPREKNFYPYGATWLSGELWNDVAPPSDAVLREKLADLVSEMNIDGIETLTGIRPPPPQPPEDITANERKAFNRSYVGTWVGDHLEQLVASAKQNSS